MAKLRNTMRQGLFNSFAMTDARSFGVFKAIQEAYPNFAKKMFEGNVLMERLVMSGFGPLDIFEYPICGKCESLALPSGHKQCNCVKTGCGHTTKNPVSFRQWMRYELKNKLPQEQIDNLDFTIDRIAESMMAKYMQELTQEYEQQRTEAAIKMGAKKLTGYGKEEIELPTVVHHRVEPTDLPENRIEIDIDLEEGEI